MTTMTDELRDSARKVLTGFGLAANAEKSWPTIVELGWLLASVPEEDGGLGLGLVGASALHSEIGRALAGAPYLSATLAIDAVQLGQGADRAGWLERLTGGEYAAASLVDDAVSVTRSGGAAKISGIVRAVPAADIAEHVLVVDSDAVAFVALGQSGVTVQARSTWDQSRPLFDVSLADVALDDAAFLASGPAAQTLSRRLAMHRDLALAADCTGGAAALLEMTVAYLQTRRQFSRPLALFQALKHRCADLKASITAAEALLADALERVDGAEDSPESALLAKSVKHLAASVYAKVAEESVQLHGGIGVTAEYPCHLYLKRALLNVHLGAGAEASPLAVAASLLG